MTDRGLARLRLAILASFVVMLAGCGTDGDAAGGAAAPSATATAGGAAAPSATATEDRRLATGPPPSPIIDPTAPVTDAAGALRATMTSAEGATGSAKLSVGDERLCVQLGTDLADAAAAHVHRGAAGESGPVVVDLTAALATPGETCVPAEAGVLDAIATDPAGFYVDVHTAAFPHGAVRGQLGR